MSTINGSALANRSTGGGSKPVLLWTNSNPSAAFAEQTLSLDLSAYDSVWIVWKIGWAHGAEDFNTIIPVGDGRRVDKYYLISDPTYRYDAFLRDYTVSSTGIYFSRCLHTNAIYNESYNTSNVPQKIYGMNIYS